MNLDVQIDEQIDKSHAQVTVSDLYVKFNQSVILDKVNFQLNAGSLVGIIGANGAGKSSLLKHISGYLNPMQGQVLIQGQEVFSLPSEQRARLLSYLPQINRVEFPYKVTEMVSLGLLNSEHLDKNSKKQKIQQVLKRLDIESLEDRQVDQLSGGEQQLVHLARILLQDTPVILLDEPSASLDIGHEAQLMNILYSLALEGKTVIVALHNLNTAAEFCDRLLLLNKGQLIADGTPQKVLTQQQIEGIYPFEVKVSTNSSTGNPNILAIKKG
ncbi:iron ABC transporter [Vibrio sp. UCD-FRSSP16_10]|uniref:ABC transporter ATP-binding protein n=1 Tax=unclassified Vibrio TaxID=2614977 RepID=UPI00080157C7|nr:MULTISPECIES: ABC transporter ATP-binding protein [unclassified Vibrio]OBT13518.1 iron ABC transporter [Vibrio sp. UCD-FRSSP16_30]OBT19977.1 iron ABC transporter [Vibrio sp. UCD-FRSSP16_10]